MALSEQARSSIYTGLSSVVDQEAVAEMLSHFPTRDIDEPVTKDALVSQIALVRTELHVEIGGLRTELKDEIAGLRTELKDEIAGLRTELKDEIAGLRTELKDEIAGLRTELKDEIAGLRTDFESALRQQLYWMVGTMITLFAICTTLVLALR